MPEKDPTTYSLITYAWVALLSAWGGAVNWIRKRDADGELVGGEVIPEQTDAENGGE